MGCPTLLPLNDTAALDFVHASLATFNNMTVNVTYALVEVGRMSSQVGRSIIRSAPFFMLQFVSVRTSILLNTLFQIVSGGPNYAAEYVVVEANCTDDACVPLNDATAVSTQSISLVIHKKTFIF